MTDYILLFESKSIAEQFGLANGFAQVNDDGVIQTTLASHTYALHEIGEHNGDGQYWVLFRDLVGIPVPAGGEQFIHWSSDMTIIDGAGSEIPVPRPEFNPDVPCVFWA